MKEKLKQIGGTLYFVLMILMVIMPITVVSSHFFSSHIIRSLIFFVYIFLLSSIPAVNIFIFVVGAIFAIIEYPPAFTVFYFGIFVIYIVFLITVGKRDNKEED